MIVAVLVAFLVVPVRAAPPPETAAPYSLTGLPSRIVHDFGRLATRAPLITLAGGGALAAAVHPADERVVSAMSGSEPADETLDGGSLAGYLQPFAALAVYGIGGLTHRPDVAEVGSALVEAQVVNGVLTQGLKFAVDRTRPNGGSHSFPSGHTSATFATADVLEQRFGWRVGLAAYAGGVYVALARVTEREHYLSDVVFGAALGIASARTVRIHTRVGIISAYPAFTRGGAAVMFSVK
jgi:membrane-associated phospholipid phosphatase